MPGTPSTAAVRGWKTLTGSDSGLRMASGATPRATAPARRDSTRTRFTGWAAMRSASSSVIRSPRRAITGSVDTTSSHSACGTSPESIRS
jgi:hypothetical protein